MYTLLSAIFKFCTTKNLFNIFANYELVYQPILKFKTPFIIVKFEFASTQINKQNQRSILSKLFFLV